jgi:hypothetical protein
MKFEIPLILWLFGIAAVGLDTAVAFSLTTTIITSTKVAKQQARLKSAISETPYNNDSSNTDRSLKQKMIYPFRDISEVGSNTKNHHADSISPIESSIRKVSESVERLRTPRIFEVFIPKLSFFFFSFL